MFKELPGSLNLDFKLSVVIQSAILPARAKIYY